MDTNQIATLLRPFIHLDEKRLAQTLTYIQLVLKWNARINLTAVRKPEDIVIRHFGESFFVAQHLVPFARPASVIDLGSGAGFPGLPFAILSPQVPLILIESNNKKAAFLNEVIRALDLNHVTVFKNRGEDFSGKADLVMMRAVEKFEAAAAVAATLLNPDGRLALMIGKSQIAKAKEMDSGLAWSDPVPIPSGDSRVLLLGTNKVKVD